MSTVKLLEAKYGTPYLHYPVLLSGAQETSKFLRTVGAYVGVPEFVTERVIQKEEARYYKYLISVFDFLSEYRNNTPMELYAVADSAYAVGLSGFLANELGFILKGVYITDDPRESHIVGIREVAAAQEKTSPERSRSRLTAERYSRICGRN